MHAAVAERGLREPDARALHGVSDRASDRPEVVAPIALGPDLEPVDDEAEAMPSPGESRSQQREVGKGGGMDDVVREAVPPEMPEDAPSELQRRCDPTIAVVAVELVRR
jgi:hypothetical protein